MTYAELKGKFFLWITQEWTVKEIADNKAVIDSSCNQFTTQVEQVLRQAKLPPITQCTRAEVTANIGCFEMWVEFVDNPPDQNLLDIHLAQHHDELFDDAKTSTSLIIKGFSSYQGGTPSASITNCRKNIDYGDDAIYQYTLDNNLIKENQEVYPTLAELRLSGGLNDLVLSADYDTIFGSRVNTYGEIKSPQDHASRIISQVLNSDDRNRMLSPEAKRHLFKAYYTRATKNLIEVDANGHRAVDVWIHSSLFQLADLGFFDVNTNPEVVKLANKTLKIVTGVYRQYGLTRNIDVRRDVFQVVLKLADPILVAKFRRVQKATIGQRIHLLNTQDVKDINAINRPEVMQKKRDTHMAITGDILSDPPVDPHEQRNAIQKYMDDLMGALKGIH